jgi:hypothetical protein
MRLLVGVLIVDALNGAVTSWVEMRTSDARQASWLAQREFVIAVIADRICPMFCVRSGCPTRPVRGRERPPMSTQKSKFRGMSRLVSPPTRVPFRRLEIGSRAGCPTTRCRTR